MSSERLAIIPLREEADVVRCRHQARALAAALQFPPQEQTRIATAVSEIARNAFCYGEEAAVELLLESAPAGGHIFVVLIRDEGPGIPDLPAVLSGRFRSTTGLGKGITGAKRLVEGMQISTGPGGTTVRLPRKLPPGVQVTPSRLAALRADPSWQATVSPLDVLASQNRELLSTLADLTVQHEELENVNVELSETNRGVVALYDELDTVYRVGRVVASKLDLDSLLQAITDATTDVSGADCGAFFHRNPEDQSIICQSSAGRLGAVLCEAQVPSLASLLGGEEELKDVYRVDDVEEPDAPPFPIVLEGLRSFLAVAVKDPAGDTAGALVFGHSAPRAFSERTERIITSVAVQASIGLENARLYHSVQAASAAKDHFLAILSHELRTPLNPVFAIIASLEERADLDAEVRDDLLVVRRNLQLEARLIDDLLDLTRIVKGKVPLQREIVDVHAIIHAARETCHAAIAKKDVHVETRLDAARGHAAGDPARLQQVLWNLLSNAVKFTESDGTILIETSLTTRGEIRIEITDSGRGISSEAIGKIFRPFEQGDENVPALFGGLGLGLAISKSIIDAHGGKIRATSEGAGQGAKFEIVLPLAEDPAIETSPLAGPGFQPEQRALRILLVDDHEDTRHTLNRLLTRRGHSVTMASTCAEAVACGDADKFDVIISDLGLPDGSGHDLMRELQGRPGLGGIALSGYGMEADIERSHAAGFSAHLTKPLDFPVLEAALQHA
ncbi:MAG: ATP-binding protein, partial [Chthoniobacteraceae bacterium]